MTSTGTEIIFEVREADGGGFWAKALDEGIVTEADTWEELRLMVKDAVDCHFDDKQPQPKVIRLLFLRSELLLR
jgi:predicted RNase H-like HicB family nuclease